MPPNIRVLYEYPNFYHFFPLLCSWRNAQNCNGTHCSSNPFSKTNAATYPNSYCALLSSATTLFLRFLARMRIDFSLLYQRHNSRNNKTAHSTRTTNTSTTSCLTLTICQAKENVTTPAKQATRMRFGAELFQRATSPRKVQTQQGNNCGWD
jgi:hypothetical protein